MFEKLVPESSMNCNPMKKKMYDSENFLQDSLKSCKLLTDSAG